MTGPCARPDPHVMGLKIITKKASAYHTDVGVSLFPAAVLLCESCWGQDLEEGVVTELSHTDLNAPLCHLFS